MSLIYTTSNRGNLLLALDGFIYNQEKHFYEKKYWRCVKSQSLKCSARCITTDDSLLSTFSEHNHPPSPGDIESRSVVNTIKEQARTTQALTQNIISDSTRNLSQAIASSLQSIPSLKRTIQRVRSVTNNGIPSPLSRVQLQIPHEYSVTLSGERFLLFDSGPVDQRILIFSTERNLNCLSTSSKWYCDGTFKVAPPLFSQLYTIHCEYYSNIIPVVYALLPNKSEQTYLSLFQMVNILKTGLSPARILLDFEQSSINALSTTFPNTSLKGCFYHLTQSVWRRIQSSREVFLKYREDAIFVYNIKKIIALAFVPVTDIIYAFEALQASEYFVIEPLIHPIMDYFEDVYIGRLVHQNVRRNPLYQHHFWNFYEAAKNLEAKTNNAVEGWHNSFSRFVGANHPSIWKFINALKEQNSYNEFRVFQILSGQALAPVRGVYKDLAVRLKKIAEEYTRDDILDYLSRISSNISINV